MTVSRKTSGRAVGIAILVVAILAIEATGCNDRRASLTGATHIVALVELNAPTQNEGKGIMTACLLSKDIIVFTQNFGRKSSVSLLKMRANKRLRDALEILDGYYSARLKSLVETNGERIVVPDVTYDTVLLHIDDKLHKYYWTSNHPPSPLQLVVDAFYVSIDERSATPLTAAEANKYFTMLRKIHEVRRGDSE